MVPAPGFMQTSQKLIFCIRCALLLLENDPRMKLQKSILQIRTNDISKDVHAVTAK